ncbi:MAG: ABC transporter permease [Chloroflexi bacterium]|nr:ABC transporter permease [Chloroflexota bacterium]
MSEQVTSGTIIKGEATRRSYAERAQDILIKYGIYIALLLLIILATILSPNFLNSSNLGNIVNQAAGLSIVAIGQTFVVLIGGIDLSVGATIGLVSAETGNLMGYKNELIPLVLVVGIATGGIIGLVNGLLITKRKLPPFVVTLGMMITIQGAGLVYTHGAPMAALTPAWRFITEGRIGPLPPAVIVLAVFAVGGFLLATRTTFGRSIYAVGGNEEASRLSGIRVDRIKILVYVIAGMTAAAAGFVLTMRVGTGDNWAGKGMELDSIAAVVMGGTGLSGGRGGVVGSVAGVFVLMMVYNLVNLLGVTYQFQYTVKGVIVIGAVALYARRYFGGT